MKKFLLSILSIVYLATSSGAVLHQHYCMGKEVSWSLGSSNKDDCPTCGMAKKKGCCDDKTQVIKLQGDQNYSSVTIKISKLPILNIQHFSSHYLVIPTDITIKNNCLHPPPGVVTCLLNILYCIYLI